MSKNSLTNEEKFKEYWDNRFEEWKKDPNPKPLTHPRWNMPDFWKVVGHVNTSYEDELNGLNEMMKCGLFDDE